MHVSIKNLDYTTKTKIYALAIILDVDVDDIIDLALYLAHKEVGKVYN